MVGEPVEEFLMTATRSGSKTPRRLASGALQPALKSPLITLQVPSRLEEEDEDEGGVATRSAHGAVLAVLI